MEFWRHVVEVLTTDPWQIFLVFLDLLLVVVFIWRLFIILRGTKGIAFLYVLAGLFAIQILVRVLPLTLFNSLVQLISPMLLVAFPVVFQPELRRALEQLGRRNPFSRLLMNTRSDDSMTINLIVQAASLMARSYVGALIVVEREQDLSEYTSTGVNLDARLSSELLRQIFVVRGPLHDGAVLIKGSRMLAAACILPLSDRTDLGIIMGTRHRSALGMSEATDAVVIIVSEERGVMSLAVDGQLEQSITPERLSLRLTELLLSNGEDSIGKRRHVVRGRTAGR